MSNSTLWSEFGVDKDDIGHSQPVCENADPSAVFPRIALMLQRSRQYPLSISVDTGGKDSLFNAFYIDRLVSLLSPHVPRICCLLTKGASWEHHVAITNILAGKPLPLLEHLHNDHRYSPLQEIIFEIPPVIRSTPSLMRPLMNEEDPSVACPKLRTLTLTGAFCDWKKMSFSGCKLSELVLGGLPFYSRPTTLDLCELLYTCKDTLEILRITSMPCLRGTLRPIPIVEMPHLVNLAMHYTWCPEICELTNQIRLPKLSILEIVNICANIDTREAQHIYDETAAAFASVVRHFPLEQLVQLTMMKVRFGPAPTDLELETVERVEDLPVHFQFFQRLRNVTHVQFRNAGKSWLRAANYHLVGQTPKKLAMPKLQLIVLKVTKGYVTVSGADILDFLRHRALIVSQQRGGHHLEREMSTKNIAHPHPKSLTKDVTSLILYTPTSEENKVFMYLRRIPRLWYR